jgi:hypothetical protein
MPGLQGHEDEDHDAPLAAVDVVPLRVVVLVVSKKGLRWGIVVVLYIS